jgi:hypothetical protein
MNIPDTICSFIEWYYTVYNVTAARQIQSSALFIKEKMKREKRAGNTKVNLNEIKLFLNHYCAMFKRRRKNPCNKSMLFLLFLNKNMLNIDIIICVYFTDKQKKRAEGEKFVIFFKKKSECVEHIF